MQALFDSRSRQFKEPFGCIKQKEQLTLRIYVKDAGEAGVLFLLEPDGAEQRAYPMVCEGAEEGYNVYRHTMTVEETGLYFYHFCLHWPDGSLKILKNERNEPCFGEGSSWQLTCYDGERQLSEDFCGQVIYQIFPDRFYRDGSCDTGDKLTPFWLHENEMDIPAFLPDEAGKITNQDFFGGNLAGIITRLPYLHSLGVRVLYLNPIFMAYSNHRYDTADYLRVDPLLGTNDDFKRLCREAHKLGMKVLLDGVFSHTGSDSRYFDIHNRYGGGAYHDPESPFREWYQFTEYPYQYTSWWGIETLPCVDECNPAYQQYIISGESSVLRYWLRQGADGWRLDVADELPDDFLYKLYETVKQEKPDSLVLGEVWEDASNKISYGSRRRYLQGGCLDSVMNYVWREAVIRFARGEIPAEELNEAVLTLCEHYPEAALNSMMNLLSTHDTPRILTALGIEAVPERKEDRAVYHLQEKERTAGKNRLYLAAFLLFTLPGSVSIYYGDEIGMEGFEDPFNRAYMGDRGRDDDIFSCFCALSKLKNKYPALKTGALRPGSAAGGVYSFWRIGKHERIFCAVNRSHKPYSVVLPKGRVLYGKGFRQNGEELLLLPEGFAAVSV